MEQIGFKGIKVWTQAQNFPHPDSESIMKVLGPKTNMFVKKFGIPEEKHPEIVKKCADIYD